MSFNKITIVGYLGRDPELRYTPQGMAVCKISVATTEKRKNVAGQTDEHTTWFRVTVWGKQAELANEYLARGRQVYIEGRLRIEEYTDRDGNVRISPEVNATDIQFLGRAGEPTVTTANAANTEQNSQVEETKIAETKVAETKVAEAVEDNSPAAAGAKTPAKKPAARRGSNKELVSIEEDDIPF